MPYQQSPPCRGLPIPPGRGIYHVMRTAIVALLAILFSQCEFGAAQESPAPHPAVVSTQFIDERAPIRSATRRRSSRSPRATCRGVVRRDATSAIRMSASTCLLRRRKMGEGVAVADGVQRSGRSAADVEPGAVQIARAVRAGAVLQGRPVAQHVVGDGRIRRLTAARPGAMPRRLPEGILGPMKNKPVVLTRRRMAVGFEHRRQAMAGRSTSSVPRWWQDVADHRAGRTKARRSTRSSRAFCFTRTARFRRCAARSRAWSRRPGPPMAARRGRALTATRLPNPNSGTDAVTLTDGRQFIVYNHSGHRIDEPKGNRWPLDVAVSDDGLTWRRVVTLETRAEQIRLRLPSGHPIIGREVHITYTWNRSASSMWCSIRRSCDWPKQFLCDEPHQQDHQRPNDRHQKCVKWTADAIQRRRPASPA